MLREFLAACAKARAGKPNARDEAHRILREYRRQCLQNGESYDHFFRRIADERRKAGV